MLQFLCKAVLVTISFCIYVLLGDGNKYYRQRNFRIQTRQNVTGYKLYFNFYKVFIVLINLITLSASAESGGMVAGARCEVTVPGQMKRRGTVRYSGTVHFQPGWSVF